MRPLPLLVLAVSLTAACSSSPTATRVTVPPAAPSATSDVARDRLEAALLTREDLPGLTQRRESTSTSLTTQATPQLALCRPAEPVGPHALASVIAQSGQAGSVKVFQIVAVYADAQAARAAWERDVESARACTSYTVQDTAYTVEDLAPVDVPAPAEAVHYRLTTPDVLSGDVRTYAVQGRSTVLVSGFGAPADGVPLLDYQVAAVRKALPRLP